MGIDMLAAVTGIIGIFISAWSETWYGWAIMAFSSVCWITHAVHTNQTALLISGVFFVISNSIGCVRRFIKK